MSPALITAIIALQLLTFQMRPLKLSPKKNLLAVALLCAAIYIASPRELIVSLSTVSGSAILALGALSFVLLLLSALKLQFFVRYLARPVGIFKLIGLYLVGNFVNLLLPSFVGGDSVRSWYLGQQTGQHESFAATILERYTNIVAMLLMSLVSVSYTSLSIPSIKTTVTVFAAITAAATALVISKRSVTTLSCLMRRLPYCRDICDETERHLLKVQQGILSGIRRPDLLLLSIFLSFLYHACFALTVLTAAHAAGWTNVPFVELFIVLPLVFTVGSLPLTPSGFGLQEGAYIYFMQNIGASPAQALSLALLLRMRSLVVALCGGIVWYRSLVPLRDRGRLACNRHLRLSSDR